MKLKITQSDDPAFVELVAKIISSVVHEEKPELVALVHIDNWFDHKWLNFSGKLVGVVGVWKWPPTLPPFKPSRVLEQAVFRMSGEQQYQEIDAPPLHVDQASSDNLNRKMETIAESGVFAWWSGNTLSNGKGSLMVHVQNEPEGLSWFASFEKKTEWKIHKSKHISETRIEHLIESSNKAIEATL